MYIYSIHSYKSVGGHDPSGKANHICWFAWDNPRKHLLPQNAQWIAPKSVTSKKTALGLREADYGWKRHWNNELISPGRQLLVSQGLEGRIKLDTKEPRKQLSSLDATWEEYMDVSRGRKELTTRPQGASQVA